MWCEFGKSGFSVVTTGLVTTSIVITSTVTTVAQTKYTPEQFRSALRGLGYEVKVSNEPLTDAETKKAVQEFQRGYRLGVDGIPGPKTQGFTARIVEILQRNLNLVLQLKENPLPTNGYYGPRTEAAVKQYQKKLGVEETGIADLALRQKLDREAREILKKPIPKPAPTATPTATPESTPTPTASPTPTATPEDAETPTEAPETAPSPAPTATPTEAPETAPSPTPTATPEDTETPTESPETAPSPAPTATPEDTETPQ